jgi:hypothetical protein
MTNEFYHKDIFGSVVDVSPLENDLEETVLPGKGRPDFNIFTFTDAVGARRKKDAWILFHKALISGMSAEEVFFKVVWQVKTMLITTKTDTALQADMKPFPYSKAKGFLKNFTKEELEKLSESLVVGYHEARRGDGEVITLVEKTILSL